MTLRTMTLAVLFTLSACGSEGDLGDACETDADCADGLECHKEAHEAHQGEEEPDGEEEHMDEGGVCEEEGAHDGHDHG